MMSVMVAALVATRCLPPNQPTLRSELSCGTFLTPSLYVVFIFCVVAGHTHSHNHRNTITAWARPAATTRLPPPSYSA